MKKNQSGLSMITVVIMIVILIILASILFNNSSDSINEAAETKFLQELSEIKKGVNIVRTTNAKDGTDEKTLNKGFIKVNINNAPEGFISFDENEGVTGYVVDLSVIEFQKHEKGHGYLDLIDGDVITFDVDDVYVYDKAGNIYYAKGYALENGNTYYKEESEERKNGPIVQILDTRGGNVEIKVTPYYGGEITSVLVGGKAASTTDGENYTINISEKGTYVVIASEKGGTSTRTTLTITDVEEVPAGAPIITAVYINSQERYTKNSLANLYVEAENAEYMYISNVVTNPSDSNMWRRYTDKTSITLKEGINKYYVWCKNNNNEITDYKIAEITLDTKIPTREKPSYEITDLKIIVTANQTDESELTIEYGYRKENETEYTWQNSNIISDVEAGEKYVLITRATDGAGNKAESEVEITETIELIPSNIEITYTPEYWTEKVEVVIEYPNTYGVAPFKNVYRINDSDWKEASSNKEKLSIITNSKIEAAIIANVEGEESKIGTIKTAEIKNIDRLAPIITDITSDNDGLSQEAYNVTAKIKDEDSGLIAWTVTNTKEEPTNWSNTFEATNEQIDISFEVSSSDSYYIWAKDNLNHVAMAEAEIIGVDLIDPEIKSVEIKYGEGKATIEVLAKDEGTGLTSYAVVRGEENIVTESDWISISNTSEYKIQYEVTQNDYYNIWVKDASGRTAVTSRYIKVLFKVTYDYKTNGGEDINIADTEIYVGCNTNADLTVVASREGYTFKGWNIDKNAEAGLDSYKVGTLEDVVLYAIFTKEVQVSLVYYDGDEIKKEDIVGNLYSKENVEIQIPKITETYTGWIQNGWTTKNTNDAEVEYSGDNIIVTTDKDMTLYMTYKKNISATYRYYTYKTEDNNSNTDSYLYVEEINNDGNTEYNCYYSSSKILTTTIKTNSYDINNIFEGSVEVPEIPETVKYGKNENDWTLRGWSESTSSEAEVEYQKGDTIKLDTDKTYYASYENTVIAKKNVYNAEPIIETGNVTMTYNAVITPAKIQMGKAENITYETYDWEARGWSLNETANAKVDVMNNAEITIYSDTTYYASYERDVKLTTNYYSNQVVEEVSSAYVNYLGETVAAKFVMNDLEEITVDQKTWIPRGYSLEKGASSEINVSPKEEITTIEDMTYYISYYNNVTITKQLLYSSNKITKPAYLAYDGTIETASITLGEIANEKYGGYEWVGAYWSKDDTENMTEEISIDEVINVSNDETYYAILEREVTVVKNMHNNQTETIIETAKLSSNEKIKFAEIDLGTADNVSYNGEEWTLSEWSTSSKINDENATLTLPNEKVLTYKDTNYYAIYENGVDALVYHYDQANGTVSEKISTGAKLSAIGEVLNTQNNLLPELIEIAKDGLTWTPIGYLSSSDGYTINDKTGNIKAKGGDKINAVVDETYFAIYEEKVSVEKVEYEKTSVIDANLYMNSLGEIQNEKLVLGAITDVRVNDDMWYGKGWRAADTVGSNIDIGLDEEITINNSTKYYAAYEREISVEIQEFSKVGEAIQNKETAIIEMNTSGDVQLAEVSIPVPTNEVITLEGLEWSFEGYTTSPKASAEIMTTGDIKLEVSDNIILYAKYSREVNVNQYICNNVNVGTLNGKAYVNTIGEIEKAEIELETIGSYAKDNMTWEGRGWSTNTSATAGENFVEPGGIARTYKDNNYYASYKADVKVNFHSYNGTEKTTNTRNATAYMNYKEEVTGATIIVPNQSSYEGWTADGYTLLENANVEEENKVVGIMYASKDMDLYGLYYKDIIITYDANGGTKVPENSTGKARMNTSNPAEVISASIEITTENVLRSGYKFSGIWTEEKDSLTNSYISGDKVAFDESKTLYAYWNEISYEITYELDGGNGEFGPQTGTTNNLVIIHNSEPTKEGYIFKGWAVDNTSKEVVYRPGEIYLGVTNATLYAVWEEDNTILQIETVDVAITGDNIYGSTLTATATTSPEDCEITYQWYYSEKADGTEGTKIDGATKSAYEIGSGIAGKYIYVEVTATKEGYEPKTVIETLSEKTAKKEPIFNVSEESIALNKGANTSVTIEYDGDGAIDIEEPSNSDVTAELRSNTIIITAVGTATATITVSASEGTNYKAAESKTISVTIAEANYSVGGICYPTLATAYTAAIAGDGTITVVGEDIKDSSTFEVETGKTITLNTNGKTINKTGSSLTVNAGGTLEITGEGTITTKEARHLIVNEGTLTISGACNLSQTATEGSYAPISGTGNLNVNADANISSANYTAIYQGNENTSIINLSAGTYTGGEYGIVFRGTTLDITGGTYTGALNGVINKLDGTVNIFDAEITGNSSTAVVNNGGTINMIGGTIKGAIDGILSKEAGNVFVSGGTIEAKTYGINNANTGKINVSGNTTIITGETALYNATTTTSEAVITVTGGIIEGSAHGIWDNGSGKVVIGTDDNEVQNNTPIIIGEECAYYKTTESSIIEFYDGILKSKEKIFIEKNGVEVIPETPDGYEIFESTETIDDVPYNTATLALGWDISADDGVSDVWAYLTEDPENTGKYVLTVRGTGAMKNFADFPLIEWKDYQTQISKLEIEEGVTTIGDRAFYNLTEITSIEIPKTVTYIGTYAFYLCTKVTNEIITIPKAVTTIGSNPFINVPTTKIIVENESTSYKSVDGVVYTADGKTLVAYPYGKTDVSYKVLDGTETIGTHACDGMKATNVELPSTLTLIGRYAFVHSKFTSIVIPSSVNSIRRYAFARCESLQNVYVESTNLSVYDSANAFANIKSGSIIYTTSKEIAAKFDELVEGEPIYTKENTTIYFPPQITAGPQDVTAVAGNTATFTVTAEVGSPTDINYKWQVSEDGGNTWDDLSITTTASYTTEATTVNMSGNQYRCIISSSEYPNDVMTEDELKESLVSSIATLTVEKIMVKKPTNIGETTFEFNGEEHSLELKDINTTYMIIEDASKTNAGEYTAQISLKDTKCYEWADGTTDPIKIIWKIEAVTIADMIEKEGLTVGDYVAYVPTASTYSTKTENTGLASKNLSTDLDAKWYIFDIKEDTNEIVLTPEGTVHYGSVDLSGEEGFINGPKEMHNISEALYSNEELEIVSRSMTVEDWNEAIEYEAKPANIKYAYYTTDVTGKEGEYTRKKHGAVNANSDWETPRLYAWDDEEGNKVVSQSVDDYKVPTDMIPAKISNTYYSYNPSNLNTATSKILSEKFKTGGSSYGWLASQCIYAYDSSISFYVRRVHGTDMGGFSTISSAGNVIKPACGIHPIVTIPASFLLTGINENAAWEMAKDNKTGIKEPVIKKNTYEYTGTEITLELESPDLDKMNIVNNAKTAPGTYTVEISLRDPENYRWSTNGNSNTITYVWKIEKPEMEGSVELIGTPNLGETIEAKVEGVPQTATLTYEWWSSETKPVTNATIINGETSSSLELGQELKGKYIYVIVTVKDENYQTAVYAAITEDIIGEKKFAKPVVDGETTYIYNGEEQTLKITGFDSNYMEISGDVARNVGTYEAKISLKNTNDTTWSDGTTTDVIIPWSIKEGRIALTVSILGTNEYGKTLTAVTSTSPSKEISSYKWYASDDAVVSADDEEIASAQNSRTYIVESKYIGKYIYVVAEVVAENYETATKTDFTDAGNNESATVKTEILGDLIEVDEIEVGDYVAYTPVSATYTPDESKTGFTNAELETNEEIKWRVLSINKETGIIKLTTEGVANSNIYLKGLKGYLHGSEELNTICEKLYSNTNLKTISRSMTIEDLNEACHYEPTENTIKYAYYNYSDYINGTTDGYINAQHTKLLTFDEELFSGPCFYVYDDGGKSDFDSYGNEYRVPLVNDPVKVTQTYYTYNPSSYDLTVGKILGSEDGWLASSSIEASSSSVQYIINSVNNSEIKRSNLFCSDGSSISDVNGLRPVIELRLNTVITGQDVAGAWTFEPGEIISLEKPTLTNDEFEYTGSKITPTLDGFDSSTMNITGTTSGKNPGTYEIKVSLRDNLNYTWVDGTTDDVILTWEIKATVGSLVEEGKIKVGDTIIYTPVAAKYRPDDAKTGDSTNVELETDLSAKWRVLSVNETAKTIKVTTERTPKGNTIYLYGATGYIKGPGELHTISEKLYSNESKGITARSMTIEDLDEACGYDKTTDSEYGVKYAYYKSSDYVSGTTDGYTNARHSTRYSNGYTEPRFYAYEEEGETKIVESETDYKVPTAEKPVKLTHTCYVYNPSTLGTANSSIVSEILGELSVGWLASPRVSAGSAAAGFVMYHAGGLDVSATYLVRTDGAVNNSLGANLRPLLDLNSAIGIESQSEGIWKIR